MNTVLYYLVLPFIYGLSILPFSILYLISDFLYFILYRVLGYRKAVVLDNLQNSFPDKSEEEIQSIMQKFYRHLCDLLIESCKILTISRSEVRKRVHFPDNAKFFEKYVDQHKSLIMVMGHVGNWELAGARFALEKHHKLYIIYHPIKNPHFEKLVAHMRTRLGNGLYTMRGSLRGMLSNRDKLTVTAFVSDQSPSPKGAYWTRFLNQDTPVFVGVEKIAQKLGYPVVYANMRKVKRGYYTIEFQLINEHPKETQTGELTEAHTRVLEQEILLQPEIWLWSHKRWKHKHKKPANLDEKKI